MMRKFKLLVCSLLLNMALLMNPATVSAGEKTPSFPEGKARTAADWVSTGTLIGQMAANTITNLRGEGMQVGLTIAVSQLTKRLTHRVRPDGSDDQSFFSEHTALAVVSGGWSGSIAISLDTVVGLMRMGANRHHPSDVAVGALVGAVIKKYVVLPPPQSPIPSP